MRRQTPRSHASVRLTHVPTTTAACGCRGGVSALRRRLPLGSLVLAPRRRRSRRQADGSVRCSGRVRAPTGSWRVLLSSGRLRAFEAVEFGEDLGGVLSMPRRRGADGGGGSGEGVGRSG